MEYVPLFILTAVVSFASAFITSFIVTSQLYRRK